MASRRRLSMDKFFRQNQAAERGRRASYHEAIHLGFSAEGTAGARPADHKAKLTKEDIGLPTNFRHLTHVGWDALAVGSPPKDYISPPTNFQHVTHISQPSKTVVNARANTNGNNGNANGNAKAPPSSDYISAPTDFQHLTHKTWDLARSHNHGILTNKQRWEKFISALMHHGATHGETSISVKERNDAEGRSPMRARSRTNDMLGVAMVASTSEEEIGRKEATLVNAVLPLNTRFD